MTADFRPPDQVFRYRYRLTREFDEGRGRLTFIMLNPSTADDTIDDPTIRRCIGFALREEVRELRVVNLFARRATEPAALARMSDIVPLDPNLGETSAWHWAFNDPDSLFVAAWGAPSGVVGRMLQERVLELLKVVNRNRRIMLALGTTQKGWPRHPLYVRGDAPLHTWMCPE